MARFIFNTGHRRPFGFRGGGRGMGPFGFIIIFLFLIIFGAAMVMSYKSKMNQTSGSGYFSCSGSNPSSCKYIITTQPVPNPSLPNGGCAANTIINGGSVPCGPVSAGDGCVGKMNKNISFCAANNPLYKG